MMDDLRLYDRAFPWKKLRTIFNGDLEQTIVLGGEDPSVTVFWGDEDGGESLDVNASSPLHLDNQLNLGNLPVGDFSTTLVVLYRIKTFTSGYMAKILWRWFLGSLNLVMLTTGDFSFLPESVAGGEMILWLDSSE